MATFTPITWLGNDSTTPGLPPTMKNADGSAINSGGVGGTLKTPAATAVIDPASAPTRTAVTASSSANNGAPNPARTPITPITQDTLLNQ